MATKRLSAKEITAHLRSLPGWRYVGRKREIQAKYRLKNFISAVKMIQKIALIAENMNHHPDLHLTDYRYLTVALTTHDAGGITLRDFILAKKIKKLCPSPSRTK